MLLTRENVAGYLCERGLLAPAASPAIEHVGRTHRVFRVAASPTAMFVKQADIATAADYEASRREASLFSFAAHDELLRRLAPRLAHREPRFGVIVTEERPGATDLAAFAQTARRAPADFETRLGHALARLHGRPIASFGLAEAGLDQPRCPFLLTLGHARADVWPRFGPIGPQVAALLRRRPRLARMLNDAQNDWRSDALIHGDLGFENIILHPRDAASPLLYFVDWEMAGAGDAAWDLATLLRAALTGFALDGEFGAIRAFPPAPAPRARLWRTYARARGWNSAQSRAELERVGRLAGIQIAGSLIERSRRSPKFEAGAIHAVEAALDLALEPGKATPIFEHE